MDILRSDIWNIIQDYLADDFDTQENLEKSLQKLKEDFPAYYKELIDLIQFQEPATNFFSKLSQAFVEAVEEDYFKRGHKIGSYQVDELISAGNMSDVYLAHRADGDFEQKVAIKVLKENIENELMEKQFQREKQILANMNHPNIAAILDGGITSDDRPYIVMEYIQGEPVTSYCNRKRLTIAERMQLFKSICMAVNYAHQNLVIHKDLKPNNIMVDGNGYIKLMDFGIAQLSEENPYANENPLNGVFTPNYASPEQLQEKNITTASDIYQLGLLLHKILTGVRYQERIKEIEHDKSIQPDVKNLEGILHQRKLRSLHQLHKKIGGDPEAIIRKALEENPEDRYPSAGAMHQDIENFFENQPLYAQENTFRYLSKKFILRNKKLINLFLLFIVLITSTTTAYFHQIERSRKIAEQNAMQARKEANRAEYITNYLVNIFKMADPYTNPQKEISVDKILNQSYQNLLQSGETDSAMQADILSAMADIFNNSGYYAKNNEAVRKSLSIKQELYPPLHPEMGKSYRQLATSLLRNKKIDSAEFYINQALKIDTMYSFLNNETHIKNIEVQGDIFYYKADYEKALSRFKQIHNQTKSLSKQSQIRVSEILSYIGDTYHQLGQYDSAKIFLTKALKIQKNMAVPAPYLIDNYTALATTYLRTEQLDSASLLIDKAIVLSEEIYGNESGELEYPLAIASRIAKKQNRYNDALHYAKRALAINEKIFGENHFFTAQRLNTVGLVHRDFGQPSKAINYFSKSLDIKRTFYPNEIKSIYITKYNYAVTLLSLSKIQESIRILEDVKKVDREIYSENHVYSAYTLIQLGRAYLDADSLKKAFVNLTEAFKIIEKKLDQNHSRRADICTLFARYYLKKGDKESAQKYAEKALGIYQNLFNNNYWKYQYTKILYDFTNDEVSAKNIRISIERLSAYPHLDPYYPSQLMALSEEIQSTSS